MDQFAIGQRVEKFTGDYQLEGTVRAVFQTGSGKVRLVVEHDPGFLHIYSPANLRPVQFKATGPLAGFDVVTEQPSIPIGVLAG